MSGTGLVSVKAIQNAAARALFSRLGFPSVASVINIVPIYEGSGRSGELSSTKEWSYGIKTLFSLGIDYGFLICTGTKTAFKEHGICDNSGRSGFPVRRASKWSLSALVTREATPICMTTDIVGSLLELSRIASRFIHRYASPWVWCAWINAHGNAILPLTRLSFLTQDVFIITSQGNSLACEIESGRQQGEIAPWKIRQWPLAPAVSRYILVWPAIYFFP